MEENEIEKAVEGGANMFLFRTWHFQHTQNVEHMQLECQRLKLKHIWLERYYFCVVQAREFPVKYEEIMSCETKIRWKIRKINAIKWYNILLDVKIHWKVKSRHSIIQRIKC